MGKSKPTAPENSRKQEQNNTIQTQHLKVKTNEEHGLHQTKPVVDSDAPEQMQSLLPVGHPPCYSCHI